MRHCVYLYHIWNVVDSVSSYQLLSRSLDYVDNEEWLMELGAALGDKEKVVGRYSNFPEEKVGILHVSIYGWESEYHVNPDRYS